MNIILLKLLKNVWDDCLVNFALYIHQNDSSLKRNVQETLSFGVLYK